MSDSREFKNPHQDYDADRLLSSLKNFQEIRHKKFEDLLHQFHLRQNTELEFRDTSVYTGTPGIALLFYKLHQHLKGNDSKKTLEEAFTYLEYSLANLKNKRISFLCGSTGPLAIAAVIFHALQQPENANGVLKRLYDQCTYVISDEVSDLPDELLYGRGGYLYALLYMKDNGIDVNDDVIKQVVEKILKSGRSLSRREGHKPPLMYKWHDKHYLGAAHGLSGILYLLLKTKQHISEDDLNSFVRPSVDYILSLKFPSGNYPSSLGNESDKLLHWCHGAPGVIHMLLQAFKVFNDEVYLDAAKEASDSIWNRGLLKKGYGLCHGVAGNAYAFLHIYQTTKEDKQLYRAIKFAEWCIDNKNPTARTPDRPLSLFEGLAGIIYFLTDMEKPEAAKFPAFQL